MIIAIDFDGTITKEHKYPEVGEIEERTIEVLKKLQQKHTICLWTCRKGKPLELAVQALKDRGVNIEWINDTPYSDDRRKIIADLYIDDRAFGGITDWDVIEEHLC